MNKFTEHNHHYTVCNWCDKDKNIKKRLIALEEVKEFQSKRDGVSEYIRKSVLNSLCRECTDSISFLIKI